MREVHRIVTALATASRKISTMEAASDLLHYIWDTSETDAFDYRVAEGMRLLFGPKGGGEGWDIDRTVERIRILTKKEETCE